LAVCVKPEDKQDRALEQHRLKGAKAVDICDAATHRLLAKKRLWRGAATGCLRKASNLLKYQAAATRLGIKRRWLKMRQI
jgi:hypothetical protein